MTDRVVDAHDVVYFDLDGVVYLGPQAVPGAEAALAEAGRSARLVYVTNNAARSAHRVAQQLRGLGFEARDDQVITSAQVAASLLAEHVAPGSRVLVAGTDNLRALIADAGFVVVHTADDNPDAAIQGYDPGLTWGRLDEVALALQRGARWFATNDDATRPTDRGLVPGLGAALQAVALTVTQRPYLFGKPHAPMFHYAEQHTGARRPLFVGDRLDTDIEGANRASMPSLLVFSGAHGKRELATAAPEQRPTMIGGDVSALLEAPRVADVHGDIAGCGGAEAVIRGDVVTLTGAVPASLGGQLDAVWAVVCLAWAHPGVSAADALESLTLVH